MIKIITGSNLGSNIIMDLRFGEGTSAILKDITSLSASDKKIYDDFFALVGLHSIVNVDTDHEIEFSHVTPFDVTNNIFDISEAGLSSTKKNKITAFVLMLNGWSQEPQI